MAMRQPACEREMDVMAWARAGGDAPALRAHVTGCTACQETLAVASWMQELARLADGADTSVQARLNPSVIWWKARMLQQWDAQLRAQAPIDVGERAHVVIGVVGSAALLAWLWREIGAAAAPTTAAVTALLMISTGVLVTTAVVAVRAMLEDKSNGHLVP